MNFSKMDSALLSRFSYTKNALKIRIAAFGCFDSIRLKEIEHSLNWEKIYFTKNLATFKHYNSTLQYAYEIKLQILFGKHFSGKSIPR